MLDLAEYLGIPNRPKTLWTGDSPSIVTYKQGFNAGIASVADANAKLDKRTSELINMLYHENARQAKVIKEAARLLGGVIEGIEFDKAEGRFVDEDRTWDDLLGEIAQFVDTNFDG
jgi:hypothetical protein